MNKPGIIIAVGKKYMYKRITKIEKKKHSVHV